jgi:LPS-assembly protein
MAGPLHLNFDGSAANFTKQYEDGARRVDFNPRLTATFGSSGLSLTPRAGVRATFYDRSANTDEPTERKFAYAGADVNARISQVYSADGEAGIGRVRHSIEPTLSYSYIPHIDQGNIPQFDYVDSVFKQNLGSIALINRLTAHYKETKDTQKYTTFDVMVFKLSRSYDFSVAREHNGSARPGSEVIGELYLKAPKVLSMTASGNYNVYDHVVTTHSEGIGFTMMPVSLNLTHSFSQGGAEYLIGGGTLALGKWGLSAQEWRDVQNKKTTQEQYILHYGGQCWGLGISYNRKPGDTQYMAMLDLKGLGSRAFGESAEPK